MKPLLVSLILMASFGQEKKDAPVIRFPQVVTPTPAPSPVGVPTLTSDQLYVVDSDIAIATLASPQGLVKLTHETGPLRVRAKFIDGDGKVETRAFNGKHLCIIEAVGVGQVELIIVPMGLTKPADILRKTIDVDNGQGPRPPPKPDPIVPVDDFSKAVAAAWQMEFSPNKKAELAGLIEVYTLGTTISGGTWGEAFTKMLAKAKANGSSGKLPNVQRVIQAQLLRELPTDANAKFDINQAAVTFTKVLKALEQLQ